MRTIKYRAWDKEKEKMISHEDLMNQDWNLLRPMAQPHTSNWLMLQYTGLKDKNGKEIYEGDVLIYENALGERAKDKEGIVVFEKAAFRFSPIHFKYEHSAPINSYTKRHVVIGNIHENPELLN